MFLWGFQQYEKRLLIEKNIEIEQLKIKTANSPLILLTNEKLELNLPKMMPSGDITRKVNLKEIFLPLNKGDIIGTLDFYYNKKLIGKTDLISATDVLKIISWKHLKKYIITLPFLFGSACFLGLFFLVIAFKLEKRRNRFR
ncbi:MAG: hypothetical protein ACD_79C00362G0003 [uncultured bacterium]|nr:MAG: hypothetical protein ACD_79C00362G0003 [uncultured bacterium]